MKLIYVTTQLPYGADEAFLLPEIAWLRRAGHAILIVPRSPGGDMTHGEHLRSISARQDLFSLDVAISAAKLSPLKWFEAVARVMRSRSAAVALKNLAVLPKAAWLARLAVRWQADHIHCHWAGTTATMAMFASEWSGVPWSFTAHRWDIVENNLLAEKARSASMARFISEDGVRLARERGVSVKDPVRVIHMGVEMPVPTIRAAGHVVLCPARLVSVKGHQHLLEAWRMVRALGVRAELWLAGDGPLRPALEAQARGLGIRDSIKFLGTLPHPQLLELYERGGIACVVLSSIDEGGGTHEGIPVALMEAMSHGVPVIGTRAGGTSELVRPNVGVLVEPANAAALAGAIKRLFDEPRFSADLGEAGRGYVLEQFDIERTAPMLEQAFQDGVRNSVHVRAAAVPA